VEPLTESNRRPSPYHPQLRGFHCPVAGRRATASDGGRLLQPAIGPEMCGYETRAVPGGPEGAKESAYSVPGRSVRPGADRSRPGRRSDDGQMILLRLRCNLECPADQVLPRLSGEFEPPALSALQDEMFPDDNQTTFALPKIRSHGRRCRDARWPARHEPHLAEVQVSTSGADSSAGASA
jgi:hypothetical protein